MRRPGVTATMRRQLVDLRARRTTGRMGGVMRVPAIMGVDEWEAVASFQQDQLIADSHEDRADRAKLQPEPVVTGKDPADVTDRYKPGMAIR